MFEELESIRNVAQVLAIRDPALTQELLAACNVFWERMYAASDWPVEFEERAKALMHRLTANGSIEATLDAMDERGAKAVARDIVRFAGQIGTENGALA